MTGTIRVLLNGAPHELSAASAVTTALARLGCPDGAGLAVARNGTVVPRADWPRTPLADGDQVEVVTAVQGG